MNTVQWLSPDEHDEWDAFVTRHPRGLVYHLSSWKRVLEAAFGHIQGQFLVLRDSSGQIQAGMPVYTVKSWLLGNRIVSVPFATMCDPLVSTEDEFKLLWPAIEAASVKQRARRIEIRTRHTGADCIPALLKASSRYKHHYLPLNKSADELLRSFNKSNIVRAVKKAGQEGICVVEGKDEQDLRALHSFLVTTRRKHLLPPMPFVFFQAMYRSLGPDRVALYLAMHEGKPVGGILVSKFKDLWTSEYSGTADDSIRGVSPFLYWETILCAKNSGAANFSFGRTSLDNEGLIIHKRRWATIEEDLTDFVSPPDAVSVQGTKSSKFGGLALSGAAIRLLMRYTPAAIHKIVGDFCYRHLG